MHTYWKVERGLQTPPFSHGSSASQIPGERGVREGGREMEIQRGGGKRKRMKEGKEGGSGE